MELSRPRVARLTAPAELSGAQFHIPDVGGGLDLSHALSGNGNGSHSTFHIVIE